jgi:hypothetical protein
MPHTTGTRYAVVSCHVERPLDDEVWTRFAALQARRPGGFSVAALLRPADADAGEDETVWLERARAAARRAPLGHHTHWTAPHHARPTTGRAGARLLAEGSRLRELGLEPTAFCGGGWYTDADVAEACVELGYVDCTARPTRPPYLGQGEPWASLQAPARVRLPSGRTLPAIPTTHSLGALARGIARPRSLPRLVHVYFHDTDLVNRSRRVLVFALLPSLARLAQPTDLATLAASLDGVPEVEWDDVART